MAFILRRIMSKNRTRYTENGFDLDLCYVTDHIIAMGYPAEWGQGLFRNPRSEVLRLLETKHGGHYRVYNLCEEKTYDPQSLGGNVVRFPFGDQQAPSLGMIVDFCRDAEQWLLADPQNTVVVHCKAGKGRTGIMICALLMHMEQCGLPGDALELFANRRTTDGAGVTIPSQRRYIIYFHYLLSGKGSAHSSTALTLQQMHLSGLPKQMLPRLLVCLWVRDSITCEHTLLAEIQSGNAGRRNAQSMRCTAPSCGHSVIGHLPDGKKYHLLIESQDLYIVFENDVGSNTDWGVRGDLKIQVFEETLSKRRSLFFTWLNTSYIKEPHIVLGKHEMDKVNSRLPSQAQLKISFSGISQKMQAHESENFLHPCEQLSPLTTSENDYSPESQDLLPPAIHPSLIDTVTVTVIASAVRGMGSGIVRGGDDHPSDYRFHEHLSVFPPANPTGFIYSVVPTSSASLQQPEIDDSMSSGSALSSALTSDVTIPLFSSDTDTSWKNLNTIWDRFWMRI